MIIRVVKSYVSYILCKHNHFNEINGSCKTKITTDHFLKISLQFYFDVIFFLSYVAMFLNITGEKIYWVIIRKFICIILADVSSVPNGYQEGRRPAVG